MATTAKDRSYTVRRELPAPARVRTTADAYCGGPIPAGTTGTVTTYSNAGFRGIEAWVSLDDGRRVEVSAGILVAA